MSEAKSEYDYNCKTGFQTWKENKEFEFQDISMSQPPLDLTTIGTDMSNAKISHLDLTPVGVKTPDPQKLKLPTELTKRKERDQKEYVPEDMKSEP